MSVLITTTRTIIEDVLGSCIAAERHFPKLRVSTYYNLGGDIVLTVLDPWSPKPLVWLLLEDKQSREGLQDFVNRVMEELRGLYVADYLEERAIRKRFAERELEAHIVARLVES